MRRWADQVAPGRRGEVPRLRRRGRVAGPGRGAGADRNARLVGRRRRRAATGSACPSVTVSPTPGGSSSAGSRGRPLIPEGRYLFPTALEQEDEFAPMASDDRRRHGGEVLVVESQQCERDDRRRSSCPRWSSCRSPTCSSSRRRARSVPSRRRPGRDYLALVGPDADSADRTQTQIWTQLRSTIPDLRWEDCAEISLQIADADAALVDPTQLFSSVPSPDSVGSGG